MNRRDIELLSAYLDGELKPSDSTRLETRLKTDPELASVLNDLRATRTLLRKLPSRKAPRNFTLTRKMVGQNPPLPRTYPFFRLATTAATLLFFFTFGLNFVGAQLAAQSPGLGMGGGGGAEVESYAAAEAPAEEPAAPAAPADAMPTIVTEMTPTEDARIGETPVAKDGENESALGQEQTLPAQEDAQQSREVQGPRPLVSSAWQIGLAAVAALGLLLMGLMRQLSARHWK